MLGRGVLTYHDLGDEIYVLLRDGTFIRLAGDEVLAFREGVFRKRLADVRLSQTAENLSRVGILEFEDFDVVTSIEGIPYDLRIKGYFDEDPIYPAPVIVHLAIEWACNLSCVYCSVRDAYLSGLQRSIVELRRPTLTIEEFKQILDRLGEWGVAHVSITGGEVLLNPDRLVELLDYAIGLEKFGVNFSTNGTLITEQIASRLADTGVENVLISLDSHIPEIHDMLRGRGTWKRVMNGIKLLQDYGMKIGIDTVVTSLNVSHLPEFARFIDSVGIPYLTFLKLKPGSMSPQLYRALLPSPSAYSSALRRIGEILGDLSVAITLDCGSTPNLVDAFTEDELSNVPALGCPVGFSQLVINPDGSIYPCAVLMGDEFRIGNALHDDLQSIWNNSPVLRRLRKLPVEIQECGSCPFMPLCRGGCRGIPYGLGQDITAPDPTCPLRNRAT